MKIIIISLFLTSILCLKTSHGNSQSLKKISISKNEIDDGISLKYECKNCFEESIILTLYKNYRYSYYVKEGNYEGFSDGKWRKNNNGIYLTSTFSKSDVPVKLKYIDTTDKITIKKSNPFEIPINLKGVLLSDSRIFINNENTYCFPFFDTCIGNYKSIDSIKIDFGNDYKSKWIMLRKKVFNNLLITAQTNVLLSNYVVFKKRCYKIVGTSLQLKIE